MSEIDWSKAPEDAQYARKHIDGLDWYKRENGIWLYLSPRGVWDKAYATSEADCEKRPQWSGDGLPPVGTVCEVVQVSSQPHDYCSRFIGQNVKIVAHYVDVDGDEVAVFAASDYEFHALVAGCFRPIRIEAQIAAEERDAFISEIAALLGWDEKFDGTQRDAGKLYDAGYHKQEPKP